MPKAIHPIISFKTAADVDALLNCQVRGCSHVSLSNFKKKCIFCIFMPTSETDSSKVERLSSFKTGPVIGRGFQTLIDSVFWYLPFVSSKHAHAVREHAHAVREKADLPVNEEEWTKKFNLFAGEHKLEDVREQLRTGWKDWFAARNPGAAGEAWGGRTWWWPTEHQSTCHAWWTRQSELCCYRDVSRAAVNIWTQYA